MNKPIRKTDQLMKIMNYSIIDLPTPVNLYVWWNLGVILGCCLMMQLVSGIFLSMHYTPNVEMAFKSIDHIMRNINYGWILRIVHANGASLFFITLYIHTARGIYYGSYKYTKTWLIGVMIMLTTMSTAFLGYVLPWGQMSYWGATVITNLLSAIPYIGNTIVNWLWGGFAVNNATLSRFFSLHFLFPFIITVMVIIHIMFLHSTGSNNPIGVNSHIDKIPFHPYFSIKDVMGILITFTAMMMLCMIYPYILSDPDNFIKANPMVTPIHIQPEWYFLFAYAILRSIPNKLGGVMALLLSISILMILPFSMKNKFKGMEFYPLSQLLFWLYIMNIILLTWIGARPVEDPYVNIGVMLTLSYFMYFILDPTLMKTWDKMID